MMEQGVSPNVTYVVKRVREKLSDGTIKIYYYVYWQERRKDGKVYTKYIAPLEKIVENYLKTKNVVRRNNKKRLKAVHVIISIIRENNNNSIETIRKD